MRRGIDPGGVLRRSASTTSSPLRTRLARIVLSAALVLPESHHRDHGSGGNSGAAASTVPAVSPDPPLPNSRCPVALSR